MPICKHEGCEIHASYNFNGMRPVSKFCKRHSKLGMIAQMHRCKDINVTYYWYYKNELMRHFKHCINQYMNTMAVTCGCKRNSAKCIHSTFLRN